MTSTDSRSDEEIRAKLDELKADASSESDTAQLAQVRALRWVLGETASL